MNEGAIESVQDENEIVVNPLVTCVRPAKAVSFHHVLLDYDVFLCGSMVGVLPIVDDLL